MRLAFILAAYTAKMFFRHIGQEPPSSSICVNMHESLHVRVFVSQREKMRSKIEGAHRKIAHPLLQVKSHTNETTSTQEDVLTKKT